MFRRTAALAVAGAIALGGVAVLVPTAATAATSQGAATTARHHRLLTAAQRRELRTSGHVTFTRHGRHHRVLTITVQRGVVTAVSPTSITLKSKDGWTHTYVITAKTKVRERRAAVDLSDVTVGERAMVVAVRTPQGDVARTISCLQPAPANG